MEKVILGVSLGTRVIGVAVMQSGELIDSRVKVFKQQWSKDKRKQILTSIERLIDYYNAKQVVVKSIDPLRTSNQLNLLTEKLKVVLHLKKITFDFYSLSTAKLGLGIKARNKQDFMCQIAERYPQLRKKYQKEINSQHTYYERIFEAVALAKWYERDLNI